MVILMMSKSFFRTKGFELCCILEPFDSSWWDLKTVDKNTISKSKRALQTNTIYPEAYTINPIKHLD